MSKKPTILSLLPLLIILLSMATAYFFGYPQGWKAQDLMQLHQQIQTYQGQHALATAFIFMGVYILYALLSLPGIFILSLFAGYLFSQPYCTIYVVIAATIGNCLLFLAARSAFSYFFFRLAKPYLLRMTQGFQSHAANYLLCLRLVPFFPFWIVNIAGAFFNVPFFTFFWTTLLGMIPSVILFTLAGRGLEKLVDAQEPLTFASLLNPQLIGGLTGLACLAVVPIIYKINKKQQKS